MEKQSALVRRTQKRAILFRALEYQAANLAKSFVFCVHSISQISKLQFVIAIWNFILCENPLIPSENDF